MDTFEYIKKVNEICGEHEEGRCSEKCPLSKYDCGLPKEKELISEAMDLVEHYEGNKYPFGRCKKCRKEFNSELISEYEIKHCPWCGEKMEG